MKRVKTRQAARLSKLPRNLNHTATDSVASKVDHTPGQHAGEPQTCSPTTLADAHNNSIRSRLITKISAFRVRADMNVARTYRSARQLHPWAAAWPAAWPPLAQQYIMCHSDFLCHCTPSATTKPPFEVFYDTCAVILHYRSYLSSSHPSSGTHQGTHPGLCQPPQLSRCHRQHAHQKPNQSSS